MASPHSHLTTEQINQGIHLFYEILGRQNQAELGWIYSETSRVKGYPGNSEYNQNLQKKVDHTVGGLAILYLFSVFESLIPKSLRQHIDEGIDKDKFYAFLHIRHAVAHGSECSRLNIYGGLFDRAKEFDDVMQSNAYIRGVATYDATSFTLHSYVWLELSDLLQQKIVPNLANKIANYKIVDIHDY